jgi:hypothetical protein
LADHSKKDQANAQFKQVQRAAEGKKAMSEYESEGVAVLAKTARLKALRMARDTADAGSPAQGTAATKKKPGKQKKLKSATLSQWLKDQHGSGRRS